MKRAALLALTTMACAAEVAPAEPQWRVVISSDALVPQFGDRLLVEVIDERGEACSGCRRELAAADPMLWPISFGVVPDGVSRRVRVRLYRAALASPDGPVSDRLLDAVVALPATDSVIDVHVRLDMRCFGVPADAGQDLSCDPETGALAPAPLGGEGPPLEVGSWGPGQARDCVGPAPPGTVCVPGGALLLGTPLYLPSGELDPVPEQLVSISSFFLDIREMTVADMRLVADAVGAPYPRGPGLHDTCTWTELDTGDEGMPVNCVTAALAAAACAARGMRLPREAEWEWAAGNLGRESTYPWLDDGEPCDRAVIAKGRIDDPHDLGEQSVCLGAEETPGPRAGGSATDRTSLGIENLVGNVCEWVADVLVPLADPSCWGPSPALRVDPQCGAAGDRQSVRGGHWGDFAFAGKASRRDGVLPAAESPFVGFRCAK